MADNEPGLVTQADNDLSERILHRIRGGIEHVLGHAYDISEKGLPELLARHRLSSTQPLTEQLAERDATIARLRKALEPFAREAGQWDGSAPDTTRPIIDAHDGGGVEAEFTLGDLRRARAVLTGEGE